MNREIDEIFKQWKEFLSWCYETNDKTTEIHRDNLERVMAYTRQLESIIKEVREEMENAKHISVSDEYHIVEHEKKLLEILEKENI